MALIRWGLGSQLYIYEGDTGYVCCACIRKQHSVSFETKDQLKTHILVHKEANDTIGLAGNHLTFQSYEELLEAVDKDDF
jgi:hypothetical protein